MITIYNYDGDLSTGNNTFTVNYANKDYQGNKLLTENGYISAFFDDELILKSRTSNFVFLNRVTM